MTGTAAQPPLRRKRSWAIAAGVVWAAAPLAGILIVMISTPILGVLDTGQAASPALIALGWVAFSGFSLIYAPFFSWLGFLIAVPVAAWMVRSNRASRIGFAVLGATIGAVLGAGFIVLAGGTAVGFWAVYCAGFGLLSALAFRFVLSRLEPEIFTAR
ncbi:MAG: hypothetical protein HLUCCA12_02605 [Rhodobacteraceae bacterium HLUCCA12]|nr:MAG: hypothetical protein HLUCCA12_02605 [Rhodobacteraceae bacterium HLUCCA12]